MVKSIDEKELRIVIIATKSGTNPVQLKVSGKYQVESDGLVEMRSILAQDLTDEERSAALKLTASFKNRVASKENIS